MSIREDSEKREHIILCASAAFSDMTAGRENPEPPCEMRTEFCRDRDRIVHSRAFRRLKQKTQVFLAPEGDHYRTRLTHTLEVDQIARTISRALRLNEDLTEAIALGHDLGHTPFGHAGERALDKLCDEGFTHYEQSVRVVSCLEKNRQGLNLCAETIDGIRCHTKGGWAGTSEGKIVRYADRIAYLNHDFEDATTSANFEMVLPETVIKTLGATKSQRITTLVTALVASGAENPSYSDVIAEAVEEFHRYMNENLYLSSKAKAEEHKVFGMLEGMFTYYVKNPDALPEFYRGLAVDFGLQRAVADYISGMSDAYAVNEYERLFIPKSWGYQS